MLNIAVIGVGWAGQRHVEAIRELGRKLTVNCLVDNDPDHLKETARQLNVEKTYTDFQDALADASIDAVSICTPHPLHCPIALAAAEAKKHILCEKPMAVTVDEATQMLDAAKANGVKLYVAENEPYSPMSKFLRNMVQSGEYIGELTSARMVAGFHALQFGYPGRRAWLTDLERGGTGTWMLHGIHSMAKLRYILGEVETVYMQEHKTNAFQRKDLEGTMSGLFTMASGAHVSVVQTCETRLPRELVGYTFYGVNGSAQALQDGCHILTGQETRRLGYPDEPLSEYAQEMEAFTDYVAGISIGPTTGESERRSLAIVQAGYESAKSGEPINLKQRFGEL